MKRLCVALLLAVLLPTAAMALPAVSVTYALTPLGSNDYRVDYTLQNLGEPGGINELMMFFNSTDTPGADFAPLSILEPAGWTHTGLGAVIPPDPGHYAWAIDWFDADPSDPGVLPGASLGGFSVSFHWSDPQAPPGSQFFEAFGTGPHEGHTVVPEPATLMLLGAGVALLGLRRKSSIPGREGETK